MRTSLIQKLNAVRNSYSANIPQQKMANAILKNHAKYKNREIQLQKEGYKDCIDSETSTQKIRQYCAVKLYQHKRSIIY